MTKETQSRNLCVETPRRKGKGRKQKIQLQSFYMPGQVSIGRDSGRANVDIFMEKTFQSNEELQLLQAVPQIHMLSPTTQPEILVRF